MSCEETVHLEVVGLRACDEIVDGPSDREACRNDAFRFRGDPHVAGRAAIEAAYCGEHGGNNRALLEIMASWSMLAPSSAGNDAMVSAAGAASLHSIHFYIVLRQTRSRWFAWRGLGKQMEQIYPRGSKDRRDEILASYKGRKSAAKLQARRMAPAWWRTRKEALRDATAQWKELLDADVERIRALRGGKLSWGVPIDPPAEPVLIEALPDESAWAAYMRAASKATDSESMRIR